MLESLKGSVSIVEGLKYVSQISGVVSICSGMYDGMVLTVPIGNWLNK